MPSLPITTRLDKKTIEKLEKLAHATKRSKSFLVAEAVDRYLHEQDWQVSAIKDSLQQAENGQFTADNEVREFFKKRGVAIED
jgi:RHH-type rel operon transcriptional repressor/antitoxin RelB